MNKKKIFTNAFLSKTGLTLVLLFISFHPIAFSQGISAIWVNEGGDKLTQEELRAGQPNGRAVINHVWDGTKVSIKGAKNEVVNFNIVLEAATQQANNVGVSFNTLTGPGGATIQSTSATGDEVFNWVGRNIELFYVRYLEIKGLSIFGYNKYDERHVPERFRRPWTDDGQGTGTWEDRPDHNTFYPDIAVPLELEPSFAIEAGHNQSIWVDIYIPKDAPAGLYSGIITITENGSNAITVPVELTVYGFALPDMPTCKTMLVFDGYNINDRFFGEGNAWVMEDNEEQAKLVQNKYAQLIHRHKISVINDDSWINSDYTTEDRPSNIFAEYLDGSLFTEANGYDGPGVGTGNNVYSVGTYGTWRSWGDTEQNMRLHSDNWVNWFDTNSPETEYFLYLIDESDNYAEIETWSQWLENNPGAGSRLKSMATISLPNAVANTPTLKIPVSTSDIGIPEAWEPAAEEYSNNPETRFFLYNGSRPAGGSFMTEDDGVALRVDGWIQFKKHINRWFYWESTYYHNSNVGGDRTDVFNSAKTFGLISGQDNVLGETGFSYSNGDGVLIYPGTDKVFPASSYDVNGPFASLRLKYWRRGIQDHDYLTIASQINPEAVQNIVNSIIPKVVWEVGVAEEWDPTWVRCDISWSANPDVWEEARDSLAKIIIAGGYTGIDNEIVVTSNKNGYLQNYPNPFSSSTTIEFEVPVAGHYSLKIYDFTGREIATLINQTLPASKLSVEWDGTITSGQQVSSGTYFYMLKSENGFLKTNKMILLK